STTLVRLRRRLASLACRGRDVAGGLDADVLPRPGHTPVLRPVSDPAEVVRLDIKIPDFQNRRAAVRRAPALLYMNLLPLLRTHQIRPMPGLSTELIYGPRGPGPGLGGFARARTAARPTVSPSRARGLRRAAHGRSDPPRESRGRRSLRAT